MIDGLKFNVSGTEIIEQFSAAIEALRHNAGKYQEAINVHNTKHDHSKPAGKSAFFANGPCRVNEFLTANIEKLNRKIAFMERTRDRFVAHEQYMVDIFDWHALTEVPKPDNVLDLIDMADANDPMYDIPGRGSSMLS